MKETASRARESCTSWIITPSSMYPIETWNSWIIGFLWVTQLVFSTNSLITIAILIFEVEGQGSEVDVGWIVCLAFMFICILLTAAEIGLSFVHALHPWTFLGSQIFKSTFWTIYFAVGIVTTVAQRIIDSGIIWGVWQIWQTVGLVLTFVVTIAALVYGAVVVHRHRKSGGLGKKEMGEKDLGQQQDATVGDVPWPSR
ncbi:hypothetical protein Q7P37_009430 [Cladosporium fusiforme]